MKHHAQDNDIYIGDIWILGHFDHVSHVSHVTNSVLSMVAEDQLLSGGQVQSIFRVEGYVSSRVFLFRLFCRKRTISC